MLTLIAFLFLLAIIGFIVFRIRENPENEEKNTVIRKRFLMGFFSLIGLLVLSIGIKSVYDLFQPSEDPSFYDTGNIEDMDEEEYQDFLKWKEKQE